MCRVRRPTAGSPAAGAMTAVSSRAAGFAIGAAGRSRHQRQHGNQAPKHLSHCTLRRTTIRVHSNRPRRARLARCSPRRIERCRRGAVRVRSC
ncbi:Hypothetical protein A7982_08972 [Minicystis rosea]|nr:Hypothetical protein A7982_08972 [Minicystis rosea]